MTKVSLNNPQEFDALLEENFRQSNIVGAAITITKDDAVVYFNGLGYADKKNKTPITEDTIFQIASISKLITGTAVMQLCERGIIDIGCNINNYLPFKVTNPHHPEVIITPRMVLTHTSSIRDDYKVYDAYYTTKTGGGDSPVPLADFLPSYLVPGGKHYNPKKVFFTDKPGTEHKYSNIGFGLLGYMVEVMSNQDFSDYCHEHIFQPLKMKSTGWHISEVDIEQLTIHYARPLCLYLKPLPPYGFPTYPDGCLKTSSADWARFIMAMQNSGEYKGTRILKQSTVDEMKRIQFPSASDAQGITFELHIAESRWKEEGKLSPGHTGGDPGIVTLTYIIPENNTTVTVFFNSELPWPPRMKHVKEILRRVLLEAESL